MGTRHLTAVIYKNEVKVAQYGQWDGYPEGQGQNVLKFTKEEDLEKFKEQLEKISFFTKEEIEELNKKSDPFEGREYLSRNTGSDILYEIQKGNVDKLVNSINFAADSLFCEWAYVIDLDNNFLEVYKGFNKSELDESERFYYLSEKSEDGYQPVKLNVKFDISKLPDDKQFIDLIYDITNPEENNTIIEDEERNRPMIIINCGTIK